MSKLPPPGVMDGEIWYPTTNREICCYPGHAEEPDGNSYVRIIDRRGVQLHRFDLKDFQTDAYGALGALMSAIFVGVGPIQKHIDNKS